MADLPVSCTLDPAALRARKGGLLQELVKRAERRRESDDAVVFSFAPSADVLRMIADVIEAERRCCRFLRFEMIVEPGEGPVHFRLSGPAGSREFLRDLLPEDATC